MRPITASLISSSLSVRRLPASCSWFSTSIEVLTSALSVSSVALVEKTKVASSTFTSENCGAETRSDVLARYVTESCVFDGPMPNLSVAFRTVGSRIADET